MTTALAIVTDALQKIGVAAIGQSLDPDLADVGLKRLNDLLDSWAIDSLYTYDNAEVVYSPTATTSVVTIGPGGDIDRTRPTRIESGFVRVGDFDYPFDIVDRQTYDSIGYKSVPGFTPDFAFYDPAVPIGQLTFYPILNASFELHLQVSDVLTQFITLAADYNLPPGYRRALGYGLAEELAPNYGRVVSPALMRQSAEAKRVLRRSNLTAPMLNTWQSGQFDVRIGRYR